MPILKSENLKSFYMLDIYGRKHVIQAVNGVSLDIEEREIYGIAGESGCGKSTLVRVLYGMIEPPLSIIDGNVFYKRDGEFISIFTLPEEELRKLRWEFISYIPQGSMNILNPVIKIIDSFWDFVGAHVSKNEKEKMEHSLFEFFKMLGLPSKTLYAYPHQLSGGMRQRVIVALATFLNPKIIIADEPTTALDVVAQRGVIQLLRSIQSFLNNTIILVTHDMGVHATISDRIGIMYAGNIIEEARTEEIYEDPLHPYTQYLIKSLPKIGDKSYKVSVPGTPPSLAKPPSGCKFHPRCNYAMEECKVNIPKFVEVKPQHKVACFLYSKEVDS